MLGKLIKYEFKATYKFMLMLYGILLALSLMLSVGLRLNVQDVINSFTNRFNIGGLIMMIIAVMFMILFAIISASVLCGMFFYSIVRFKNNLLGNEGYLMHTLPAKESDHIFAKLIVSVIWTIAGVLVISSSKAIAELFSQLPALIKMWYIHYRNMIPEFVLYVVEIIICCIVNLVYMYLHIYASMAVGYSFNSHKALISVGTYIGIAAVFNIIKGIAIIPFQTLGMFNFAEAEFAVKKYFPGNLIRYAPPKALRFCGAYHFKPGNFDYTTEYLFLNSLYILLNSGFTSSMFLSDS